MELYKGFTEQMDYLVGLAMDTVPVEDWAKIELVCRDVNNVTEWQATYWLKGQSEFDDYFDPDEDVEEEDGVWAMLDGIKLALSHQFPEEGGWLTATIHILPDGSYDYEFDYELPPQFEHHVADDGDWLAEWYYFPRTRTHTPPWWIDILERHGFAVVDTLPDTAKGDEEYWFLKSPLSKGE